MGDGLPDISRFGPMLAGAGWDRAVAVAMSGDASSKAFARLRHPDLGRTAVLMWVPEGDRQTISKFADVDQRLRRIGLSAPEIIVQCDSGTALLLEDLGDYTLADDIAAGRLDEDPAYATAVETLIALADADTYALPAFDPEAMAEAADWAFVYHTRLDKSLREEFKRLIADACRGLGPRTRLSLRDCHAQNMTWLGERHGAARVGLLDFQDAVVTHPIYDLVSLLQDARRDVDPTVVDRCKSTFRAHLGMNRDEFDAAFAVIGAQRSLRIIGVFAKLSAERPGSAYGALLPRVFAHLERALAACPAELERFLRAHLSGVTA